MRPFTSSICCMTLACTLAACASSGRPNATVAGALAASDVTVYSTPLQVPTPYREVAVLIPGRGFPTDTPDIQALRTRAAALGATGIILDAALPSPAAARGPEYSISVMPPDAPRTVAIVMDSSTTPDLARER